MRRTLSIIIALCMTLTLTACGKGGEDPQHRQDITPVPPDQETISETATDLTADDVEYVLSTTQVYPLPAGCSVRQGARIGSRLLVTGYDQGVPVAAMVEYQVSPDGSLSFTQPTALQLDTGSPYCQSLKALTAGADGCFYLLAGEHAPMYLYNDELRTNDEYQGRLELIKLSAAGELLDSMKIDGWHSDTAFGLAVDTQGRIYLMGSDYVSCFTWGSSDVQTTRTSDGLMCSIQLTAQGVVLSCMEGAGYKYHLLDGAQIGKELSFKDPGDAPTLSVGNMSICQGLDGEYIVSANSRFVECSPETGETRELYQWDFTSFPGGAQYALRLGEAAFACTVGTDHLLCTALVAQEKAEKTAVNVAAYDMGISNVGGIVSHLNNSQNRYVYYVTEYGRDESSRLIADITAGTVDLVIHNNLLDVRSDMFLDLYPYVDRDLGRDSFIPNILETLSDGQQLHEIWEGVEINTLAARTADVEGREGLSPWDWQQIVAESGQYEAVFQSFMDRENYLLWLSQVALVQYMDRDAASCAFDSEGFTQLLAWAQEMGGPVQEGSDSPSLDISQVALSVETISDPVRLTAIRSNFGQDITFVGFPTGGKGLSYYTSSYNGSMAIPANSSNVEGAWAYISYVLSPEHQNSMDYALPVSLTAFTRRAEGSLEPDLAEKLLDLAASTTAASRCTDQQIVDIILELGRAYLAGDKSLEETVQLIQSRAGIYLAEQYG